jgi:hypothetical protein
LKSGLGTGSFAENALQLVELRNQAGGVCQGLEVPALFHQQNPRNVSSRYQLHGRGGHIGQNVLERAGRRNRTRKLWAGASRRSG